MNKHCIGCQREISWGDNACPFCGASQSYIKYHFKSVVLVIIVLGALGYGGKTLFDLALAKSEQKITEQSQQELTQAKQSIAEKQTLITDLKKQLADATQKIEEFEKQKSANASQAQAASASLKQQLDATQKELEKQQGRAGWLGRENTRLKNEMNTLQQKLVQATTQSANNSVPLPASSTIQPALPAKKDPEGDKNRGDGNN